MIELRSLAQKRADLQRILVESVPSNGLLLVAYSGGVDSAYLAWEASAVLAGRMLAVIADSPSLPRKELAAAIEFAALHSIPLHVVHTAELQSEKYARNDTSRCFHCKDELFRVIEEFSRLSVANLEDIHPATANIAYGRNLDDDGDFRPGQHAAQQHAVLSPLAMAGMGKRDVRALAQQMGLALWDKPASACLASRIEYGRPVTAETLRQIELAEDHLHRLGFRQIRVRHHGEVARIEIDRSELPQALSVEILAQISACVRACGFKYVALDADGYRSGSMNDMVPIETLFANS
jgi:uncharacterized protein